MGSHTTGTTPATDEVKITSPVLRWIIPGRTARTLRKAALMLRFSIRSQASGSPSAAGPPI